MLVPGITMAGSPPSMLRNVLPRPTVSQEEYPDAGYIRVTGPKGMDCDTCSQTWNGDVDSRRNLSGLSGINFGALGRGIARGGLGFATPYDTLSPGARIALGTLQVASIGANAFHGFKRNNSVGWAIWWGLMGGIFPVVSTAVAVAQGFGKRRRR